MSNNEQIAQALGKKLANAIAEGKFDYLDADSEDFANALAMMVLQDISAADATGYFRAVGIMLGHFNRPLDCKPDGTGLDDGPALPRHDVIRARKPMIIAAWKEGLSTRSVARIFDVSHETVSVLVKDENRPQSTKKVKRFNAKSYPHAVSPGEEFFNRARDVNFGIDPYCEAGNADYCDDAAEAIIKQSEPWVALERIAKGIGHPAAVAKRAMEGMMRKEEDETNV